MMIANLTTVKAQKQNVKFSHNGEVLEIPIINNTILYSAVFDINNKDAESLYNRAKDIPENIFQTSTVTYDHASNTVIIDSYEKPKKNRLAIEYQIHYTVKIECRDNRYKLSIYNFVSKLAPESQDQVIINDIVLGYDFSYTAKECLDKGVSKSGKIKSNSEGKSLIIWSEIATNLLETIPLHMRTSQSSNDW